jgi:hypothetical protein
MGNKTCTRLMEGHIYRLGDLLLEAACCDGWTLNVLTNSGEYVPVTDGSLIAYELRPDGQWDRVYCCVSPLLPAEEECTFDYGETVQIALTQLICVATCRSDAQEMLREQEYDRQIREVMAAMEW